MGKFKAFPVVIAVVAGGLLLLSKYRIEGLDQLRIVSRQAAPTADPAAAVDVSEQDVIRIGSFNIQIYGTDKVAKPEVMEILARIVRNFDVIAIQEVRSQDPNVIPDLVQAVNADGRHYNYVIGPRLGRTSSKEQYAYIFNEATLEVDRNQLYTIDDQDDMLHRPPLVAWFRVRGPPTDQAFTFSLVNVHTDPDEVAEEMNAMDNVLLAVRADGRGEDDVILLGDFNTSSQALGELGQLAGLVAAITSGPTNTRQTNQYDNLFFQLPATAEYTGRSDVFDFMRQYNLTLEQALQVSDHLPVWAEFRALETADPTAVATVPTPSQTR